MPSPSAPAASIFAPLALAGSRARLGLKRTSAIYAQYISTFPAQTLQHSSVNKCKQEYESRPGLILDTPCAPHQAYTA
jgi:hypothetical protein